MVKGYKIMKNIKGNKDNVKSSKKITKISDLNQIDGQIPQEDNKAGRLDVLFAENSLGKYGTLDKQEYINKIEGFSTAELRNHAIKAGLIPIANIARLKKQLYIEFDKYILSFRNPNKLTTSRLDKSKEDTAKKILSVLK